MDQAVPKQPSPISPPAPPCLFVLFGSDGDLAKRKLLPSLFHLERSGLLPDAFVVVGFSRVAIPDVQYRKEVFSLLEDSIATGDFDASSAEKVAKRFHGYTGDFLKFGEDSVFATYLQKLDKVSGSHGNMLFYLATPPEFFEAITNSLAKLDLLNQSEGWRRIVLEKPFGRDLKSAQALNLSLGKVAKESQIYRIDHYLGKETVENILVFRFGNGIFEPIWNRNYIDSIQITVAETLGVEHRASFYEKEGALRDMVSSHMLQLLSLVAMESPVSFRAEDVQNEKVKALKSIRLLSPDDAIRGQYGESRIGKRTIPAYREEPGVARGSMIETYVAMKLEIDNWRWAGVPFYIRVGKRLPVRNAEIAIQFKGAPFQNFRDAGMGHMPQNFLVLQLQPEQKIEFNFCAKIPGPSIRMGEVKMSFDYRDFFARIPSTGYETMLYDCMQGDEALFTRADQVEESWRVITPILNEWIAKSPKDFPNYASGSSGPSSADELLRRDGRKWRTFEPPEDLLKSDGVK
jgi:glucose-6-phosphate 1-dehydrogenase